MFVFLFVTVGGGVYSNGWFNIRLQIIGGGEINRDIPYEANNTKAKRICPYKHITYTDYLLISFFEFGPSIDLSEAT